MIVGRVLAFMQLSAVVAGGDPLATCRGSRCSKKPSKKYGSQLLQFKAQQFKTNGSDDDVGVSNTSIDTALDFCGTSMRRNNLGGLGPDGGGGVKFEDGGLPTGTFHYDEVMQFKAVATMGLPVDLEISANSSYEADHAESNGLVSDCFGNINMRCGTSVRLRLRFLFVTGNVFPFGIGKFWVLFSDIDQGIDGRCSETLTVESPLNYVVVEPTELSVREEGDTVVFGGTTHGDGTDNPTDLEMLTSLQKRRMVAVQFDGAKENFVYFNTTANDGFGSRNLRFSGAPPNMLPPKL